MAVSYTHLDVYKRQGKGKNISMETLVRICEALNCGILDVIELEQDTNNTDKE